MRRFAVYLLAVVANATLAMVTIDALDLFWLVLLASVAGQVAVLRLGPVWPAFAAPPAVIALMFAGAGLAEALGAHCPRSGMDYLNECNDAASFGLFVFYGGIYALMLCGAALVLALALRGAVWVTRAARA